MDELGVLGSGIEDQEVVLEVGQGWSGVRIGLAAERGSRRVREKVVVEVGFLGFGGLG